MCGGAPLGTPKLSLPGCVLGVSDQVGKVRDRRLRTRHHDVRHLGDHRDRLKTFRIVFDVAIKRRSDGKRRRAAEKERVAVGLGIGGDLAGERRAGAGPVVDINLLSELVRQRRTDQPTQSYQYRCRAGDLSRRRQCAERSVGRIALRQANAVILLGKLFGRSC